MGCGGSRLGSGAAAGREDEGGVVPVPAGIRPLLRRRLEEMKKRSHASVLKGNQTLSKKELLRHGSSEEVDDGEETEEKHDSLKLSAKVAPAPDHHVEEKKEVIYEKISSRDDVTEVKKEEEVVKKQDEDNHHDVVDDVAMNVKNEEDDCSNHNEHDKIINDKEDEDESVDHDEGRMRNFDERMICPGSPSFRVYCVDVTSDDEEEEKDAEDTRKSMETESVMMELKEDESIVKKEKRVRKGKRFGIALPRKYLANVTAGCMGNHTHARLVQEKSSQ